MDERKDKTLYRALINDQKSNFCARDRVKRDFMKKSRKSLYPRDRVFVKIYNEIYNNDKKTIIIHEKPPLNTPFDEKCEDIDRSTLHSFRGPFKVLQVDIADIQFMSKPTADPKYCLLFVDLFTSIIYTYKMKRRSLLPGKK